MTRIEELRRLIRETIEKRFAEGRAKCSGEIGVLAARRIGRQVRARVEVEIAPWQEELTSLTSRARLVEVLGRAFEAQSPRGEGVEYVSILSDGCAVLRGEFDLGAVADAVLGEQAAP